jgi:hypothetical protein
LKDTVDADLPVWKRARMGRPRHLPLGKSKVLKRTQNKLQHARRRYKTAEAALRALQRARDDEPAHRITAELVAKVALSAPSSSARAFADAWADLSGVGAVGCSRRTIGRVRDAFSEAVKELYSEQVGRAARRSRATQTLETAT